MRDGEYEGRHTFRTVLRSVDFDADIKVLACEEIRPGFLSVHYRTIICVSFGFLLLVCSLPRSALTGREETRIPTQDIHQAF